MEREQIEKLMSGLDEWINGTLSAVCERMDLIAEAQSNTHFDYTAASNRLSVMQRSIADGRRKVLEVLLEETGQTEEAVALALVRWGESIQRVAKAVP